MRGLSVKRSNNYIWLGSNRLFKSVSLMFQATQTGAFVMMVSARNDTIHKTKKAVFHKMEGYDLLSDDRGIMHFPEALR